MRYSGSVRVAILPDLAVSGISHYFQGLLGLVTKKIDIGMFWNILGPWQTKQRFDAVRGILDERSCRLVAAAEGVAIGRGGVSVVSRASGVSRQVIRHGVAELSEAGVHPPGRVRYADGGRKTTILQDDSLLRDLESLVEPSTPGDPTHAEFMTPDTTQAW
jgi:hypothetical protein